MLRNDQDIMASIHKDVRLEVFSVIKDISGITLQVSRFDFSLPPYTAKIFHMSKLD